MISHMLGEEETLQVFVPIEISSKSTTNLTQSFVSNHLRYTPTVENQKGVLSYSIEMPLDAELFFYMPSDYPREVKLELVKNGSRLNKGTFHANETTRIISLGNQSEGDRLTLDMTLTTTYLYPMIGQDCFYYIDWTVFKEVMARLATDQLVIADYTESSFLGTFTPSRENELVMTTIPYDKGWKVYVDGVEVETVKALGSLVAFRVEGDAGEIHEIKMIYRPNTFVIGTIVSLLSLALLLLIILFEKRIRRLKYVGMLVAVDGEPIPDETASIVDAEKEDLETPLTEPNDSASETDETTLDPPAPVSNESNDYTDFAAEGPSSDLTAEPLDDNPPTE